MKHLLWIALLFWLGVAAATTPPLFTAIASGTAVNPELRVNIQPASDDIDSEAGIYVLAYAGDAWYTLDGGDWRLWSGGNIPALMQVRLSRSFDVQILNGSTSVTGLAGVPIFIGYGRNDADMLARTRFDLVHVLGGGEGQLYVLQGNTILRFASPDTLDADATPVATLSLPALSCAKFAAHDPAWDRLYIADPCAQAVLVIDRLSQAGGAVTPSRILKSASFSLPTGIAYDWRRDMLFVTNPGNDTLAIFEHASMLNGNHDAARVVKGTATHLNAPYGLWSDSRHDRLYLTNRSQDGKTPSIIVFEAAASAAISGNIFPNRIYSGTATRLSRPSGITLDAAGNLLVADSGAAAVLVYPEVSLLTGNNTPTHVLQGTATALLAPEQPVLSRRQRLWVGDSRAAAIPVFFDFPRTGNVPVDMTLRNGLRGGVSWLGLDTWR